VNEDSTEVIGSSFYQKDKLETIMTQWAAFEINRNQKMLK
jgi:hypothetical protein